MITARVLGLVPLTIFACGEESTAEPPEAPTVRALFDKIRDAIPPADSLPACVGAPDGSWPLVTWRGLNLIADHQHLTGGDAPRSPPPELDNFANPNLDHSAVASIHDRLSTTSYKSRVAKELLAAPGFLVTRVDRAKLPLMNFDGTFLPGRVDGRVLWVGADARATCATPFSATSSDHVQTDLVPRSKGEAWLAAELRGDLSERTRAAIRAAAGLPPD